MTTTFDNNNPTNAPFARLNWLLLAAAIAVVAGGYSVAEFRAG